MSLKEWIIAAFSGQDNASIKRIAGFIIIMADLVLLYFTALQLVPVEVWKVISPFCELAFWISTIFFGVNAAIDIAKLVKGEKP